MQDYNHASIPCLGHTKVKALMALLLVSTFHRPQTDHLTLRSNLDSISLPPLMAQIKH